MMVAVATLGNMCTDVVATLASAVARPAPAPASSGLFRAAAAFRAVATALTFCRTGDCALPVRLVALAFILRIV